MVTCSVNEHCPDLMIEFWSEDISVVSEFISSDEQMRFPPVATSIVFPLNWQLSTSIFFSLGMFIFNWQREFPPHYFLRICNKNRFFSKKHFIRRDSTDKGESHLKRWVKKRKPNIGKSFDEWDWGVLFWLPYPCKADQEHPCRRPSEARGCSRPGRNAKTEKPSSFLSKNWPFWRPSHAFSVLAFVSVILKKAYLFENHV